MDKQVVVDKVREYLGTPYQHQGRLPGVGLDCAGVAICAANELGLSSFNTINYARTPDGTEMLAHLKANATRVRQAQPGDILLMRFDKEPQHLAIVTEVEEGEITYILHSYAQARKVTEHGFDDVWKKRVLMIFRIPGVV